MVSPMVNDSEAQVRQPLLSGFDYPLEKPTSAMHQDDIELRVGNDRARSMRSKTVKVLTKGLKGLSVLLIAYLAVNGFWALVRPDLYARYATPYSLANDDTDYSRYVPHFPKFPGEPDYEHRPGHGPGGPHHGPCGPPGPPHRGPGGPPGPPHRGPGGPPGPPHRGPGGPPGPPPRGPGGPPRGPGGPPRGPGGPHHGPGGPDGPGRGPGGPPRGPGGPHGGPHDGPHDGPHGGPHDGPHDGPGGPDGPPDGPDGPDGPDDMHFGSSRGRAGQHARFTDAPRSEESTGFANEYSNYDGSGTSYKQLSTSSTPSNAKKYLPNHVWSCAKLAPGKVLTIGAPIEWRGQHVQVGPSLAGSEVTFVWDGKVGTPPPKEVNMKRDEHHGPPPGAPKDLKIPPPWKFGPKGIPPKKPTILNDPTREYTFNNWTAVFELKIPAAPVWAAAKIDPEDVRICSLRELDMTGIGFFTKDGIPPKHGNHTKGFDEISTKFKAVVHLPSDFTRVPMRAGAPPPPLPEPKKTSSASTSSASLTVGKASSNTTATKASMVAEVIEVKGSNKAASADTKDEAKSAKIPKSFL